MKTRGSRSRDALTDLFTSFAGQGGTLVIPRPYIDLCKGDHLAALFLSQCLYWTDRTKDVDGWFSKSFEEWDEELAMSTFQIRRVVKSLASFGVEVKKRRSRHHGGAPTLHYRVNKDVIAKRISEFLGLVSSSLMEETSYSDQQETHYSYTETTQRLQKESAASDEARARPAQSSETPSSVEDTAEPAPEQPAKEARARTPRQIEAVAAAEGLAAAMGVTLASSDYGLYKKHAALLVSAGVTLAEFDLYVKRVRRQADGKWTVSVTSLTANGRISEYITARDAHRARQQAGDAQGQWTGETASAQYHQPAVIVPESTTVSADVLTMFEEVSHD